MCRMKVCLFLLFLFIIKVIIKYEFVNYNKNVYKWHCDHIYPFHEKLSDVEQNYIHNCINLSYWELLRPLYVIFDPFIVRLSYFTYSHRVKNGKANSSRIAYGAAIKHKKAYENAIPVLAERRIVCEIIPDKNIHFGGLGWDIENGYFKIYFRFFNYERLSTSYKKLLSDMKDNCKSGLLSITYDKDGFVFERKIYCYPKSKKVANLKSETRNDIQQDCHNNMNWRIKVCDTGKKILDIYENDKYTLDAITYKDNLNYTMYFPKVG